MPYAYVYVHVRTHIYTHVYTHVTRVDAPVETQDGACVDDADKAAMAKEGSNLQVPAR